MLRIEDVEDGGIGEEMGLVRGDRIISVNSHKINDSIDYAYFLASGFENPSDFKMEVKRRNGRLLEIEAELDDGDDLGLDFPPLKAATCKNRCIFCFVHQLPKGLRRSLYVKDEDFRLSFLLGNYVTLSKISKEDIERIKEQKLSPLYISVHSTDEEIRSKLLGVTPAWNIMSLMAELAEAGIEMHAQIVVCPGINDAESLKKSIIDLYSLHPSLLSLAVVPVGITSHRERLSLLRQVTREDAFMTVALVNSLQSQFRAKGEGSFVFLADEYYLKAEADIPAYYHYEDFPQLENGVGLLASFKKEAKELLIGKPGLGRTPPVSVVTGHSPFDYIAEFTDRLNKECGAHISLFAIDSELLGETVTVTGLISGGDIIRQLKGKSLGKKLLVPNVAMRDGHGKFLDDLTVDDIKQALGVDVAAFESTPSGFVGALLG